uniref:Suppressor of cytokine signaling 7 n=1 Tax=Knipowitschia caucasica TaxID=637954 RepID=A0AAV2KGN5_KNICA
MMSEPQDLVLMRRVHAGFVPVKPARDTSPVDRDPSPHYSSPLPGTGAPRIEEEIEQGPRNDQRSGDGPGLRSGQGPGPDVLQNLLRTEPETSASADPDAFLRTLPRPVPLRPPPRPATRCRLSQSYTAAHCLLSQSDTNSFASSLRELEKCGWYWGPMTWLDAEAKLRDKADGSFLVRDSSDPRYILSLSFRSQGLTHHTRMEHYRGLPPTPVQLLFPVSRFSSVKTLQHLCRFCIRQAVRIDHVEDLPLPGPLISYLRKFYYYDAEEQQQPGT